MISVFVREDATVGLDEELDEELNSAGEEGTEIRIAILFVVEVVEDEAGLASTEKFMGALASILCAWLLVADFVALYKYQLLACHRVFSYTAIAANVSGITDTLVKLAIYSDMLRSFVTDGTNHPEAQHQVEASYKRRLNVQSLRLIRYTMSM